MPVRTYAFNDPYTKKNKTDQIRGITNSICKVLASGTLCEYLQNHCPYTTTGSLVVEGILCQIMDAWVLSVKIITTRCWDPRQCQSLKGGGFELAARSVSP
jgi:hypothetical protein